MRDRRGPLRYTSFVDVLSNQVGPLSVLQWIGAVVVGLILLSAVPRLFRSKTQHDDKLAAARCLGCGWQGKVSKYHRTCPKCGNQITRMSKNEA